MREGLYSLIEYRPTPADPLGSSHAVRCHKHNATILVEPINMMEVLMKGEVLLENAVNRAAQKCPGCVYERAQTESKWPEGAEL